MHCASTQFLNPRCAIITLRGRNRKRLLIELDRFGVAKICITCHVDCNLDGRQHAKKSEVVVANSTLLWSLKPLAREFPAAAASINFEPDRYNSRRFPSPGKRFFDVWSGTPRTTQHHVRCTPALASFIDA